MIKLDCGCPAWTDEELAEAHAELAALEDMTSEQWDAIEAEGEPVEIVVLPGAHLCETVDGHCARCHAGADR